MLGVEISSYRRAASAFDQLLKVPLSKSSLQQLIKEYGSELADREAHEAECLSETSAAKRIEEEQPEPDAEIMAVSMDGVMVHVRGEGWKEAKVAAISAVEQKTEEGQIEVCLTKHSYRAGVWGVPDFTEQQWAEAWRRGMEKAKQVVSVNDGAHWIWSLVRTCYTPCIEVIDWWHAVEHVWEIARLICKEDTVAAKAWASILKTLLWNGQIKDLIREVRERWPQNEEISDDLRRMLRYFIKYRHQMRYADFRAQGYPIGSGTVESACKTVVQGRVCQAGMRWSRQGLRAMLVLRCALLSKRWRESLPLLPFAQTVP